MLLRLALVLAFALLVCIEPLLNSSSESCIAPFSRSKPAELNDRDRLPLTIPLDQSDTSS